jgi:MFS family permease
MNNNLFRNRDFVIIWGGQSISILGDNLFGLALLWWVVSVTGSGTAMSSVALAGALHRIFLAPLLGVSVDRIDRRLLMTLTNLVNGVITLIMAVLFWQGTFSLWVILVSAALMGAVSTLHSPAFEASIPAIVGKDDLVRANSLMQSANSIVGLVTPAISGVIIAVAGVGTAVLIDAVTFFIAALSLLFVNIPKLETASSARASVLREAMVGFRFVSAHGLLLPMLVFFSVINLTLAPMSVALPILVLTVLKGGPTLMGLFGSFQSAGVLAVSTLLSAYPGIAKRTGLVLVMSIVGIGLSTAVIGLVPSSIALLGGAVTMGMTVILANVASQSIWQREVPAELRGRVFAARTALSSGLRPLGLAVTGPLTDLVGSQWLIGAAGLLCALAGLFGFAVPGLRQYPREALHPERPAVDA